MTADIPGLITRYYWQDDLIKSMRDFLYEHTSVLLCLATGGGKSVIAAFMALAAASKGKRVVFICHRIEILHQIAATFQKVGLSYGIIAANFTPNPNERVQIASIDTLKRRCESLGQFDLVVVDEVHHVAAAGWSTVVNFYRSRGAKIVGLTATPWRLSGEGLGHWFEGMVRGPKVGWLIENGFLSKYKVFAPPPPDLSGVHTKMGEFDRAELCEVVDKPAIFGQVVEHYAKMARGKKAIAYCVSRKHSENVAASFNAAGISAAHIDGETDPLLRKSLIRKFADGEIDVITNVEIATEGVDLGALAGRDVTVECVALLRPTKSLSLHLQMIGRALRPKPEPAIILDHVGNTMRMREMYGAGLPDDDFPWTLEDRKKRKKSAGEAGEPTINVRQCPQCFLMHAPAPACPNCGHPYQATGRPIRTVDGDLVEFTSDPAADRLRAMTYYDALRWADGDATKLFAIARAKRFKRGWVHHVLAARAQKRAAG